MPQKSKTILTNAFYWLIIAIEKQKRRGCQYEQPEYGRKNKKHCR